MRQLTRDGGLLDYGPARSRLLIRVMRTLAQGRPVSGEQVDQIIEEVGITRDDAHGLLSQWAERDAGGGIAGILGLSLNETPHRLTVDGRRLFAWCAMDTLFLPAVLGQTATVESESPVTGAQVRLTVSPRRVEAVDPVGAVVSMVVVDPDAADASSVEAIWGTFCHRIFFFASEEEAERWAAGRDDRDALELLSVDEAFELGRLAGSRLLAHGA
jgi:alkylmercury lyase